MLQQFKDAYIKPIQPHLHIIVLITGLLTLILTVSFSEYGEPHPRFHQLFLSLSSALLAGGIFAVIAKSHQLMGLFLQDIEKVIHSHDHYEVRRDKKELWSRAMTAYHGGAFPEIENRIINSFDTDVSGQNHEYYYKNATRWITIKWDESDVSKNKISVEVVFSGTIVPRKGVNKINIKTIIESIPKKSREELQSANLITINDQPINISDYEHTEVNGMNRHAVSFEAPINGPTTFRRVMSWIQDISLDSLEQFAALSYIDDLTVIVNFPKGLDVVFNPYGVSEFVRKPEGISRDREIKELRIERQFKELLFANQGYILVLSKR